MVLKQQEEAFERRHITTQTPKTPELFELVRVENTGYDPRDQVTFTKETTQGIYSTELGAYKAGLGSGYKVRPLKVND